MSDIDEKVAQAEQVIANAWSTTPPEGGSKYTEAVFTLFKQNPGKSINAKGLKEIFSECDIDLESAGSILASLARQDKITRVSTGWYQLATPQE